MKPVQQNPSNNPEETNDEQNTIRSAGPGTQPGKNRPSEKNEKTMPSQTKQSPGSDQDDNEELNQNSDNR